MTTLEFNYIETKSAIKSALPPKCTRLASKERRQERVEQIE